MNKEENRYRFTLFRIVIGLGFIFCFTVIMRKKIMVRKISDDFADS